MMQNYQSTGYSDDPPFLPTSRSFIIQIEVHVVINKGQFYGRIEHIVTGKSTRFHSLSELLAFIENNI